MANRVASCPAVAQPRCAWYRQIFFVCHFIGERERHISQIALCQEMRLVRLSVLHPRMSDWYIRTDPLLAGEPFVGCFGQYPH